MSQRAFESLRVEFHDVIAEVVLTGPARGNALGMAHFRELHSVFESLDGDEATRVAVVRADGKHFTYGLDLPSVFGELAPLLAGESPARDRVALFGVIQRLQAAYNAIERCRKPVIAALHGWCIGAGIDLVTACDVRLCSADARFSVREVKVAIVADLGSLQRLPRIVGEGLTRELALTGDDFDAARALQIGFVNATYETPEALVDGARAMARKMASNPPLVVSGVKQILNASRDLSVEDGLRHVAIWNSAFLQSRDLGEALAAFMERREPNYTGE